ncbi:hypothetical protein N7492_006681 [Penicillium capsulatum]|uniref:Mis12-Mtw1 family protein n=1 Tax=Penicillium capsulatum TaxID=69766 RepID=A0A9W9HZT3_9EURO|nr:hypothetical protein N7492_006681 [Penicillium capsulatum]KAJ6116516.1 hypothetical protein N7512_006241 [Penicillium capsulatum]
MTTAVLAATTTTVKRREPLRTIGMAASQAQSRPAPASGGAGRGRGRPTRNSASQQGLEEITTNEGKRKADYEEDEEGFLFSRLPSKKSKPSPIPEAEHSDVENVPSKPTPRKGRPPKKRTIEDAGAVSTKGTTTELPARKTTRGAAKKTNVDLATQSENNRRASLRHSETPDAHEAKKPKKGRTGRVKNGQTNGFISPGQPPAGTKVALPAADTPVIQRNKELRGAKSSKGGRRSSLGMRGRRASSLIDSGASNALPHREVGTAEFYKHIADDGLPEPRRMRQLLIWCATRALSNKASGNHSEDQSTRLAARVIQEELLKDFSSKSELSNWFSREEVAPPTVVVKRPNPRNVQNMEKIKELEEQIQKLQKERHALNALMKQPAIPRLIPESPRPSPNQINPSLLDPSQKSLLGSLNPSPSAPSASSSTPITHPPMTPSTVSTRLSRITTGLAPTLDAFAAGVHDIEIYRSTADAVSSRILRVCAQRLEERDQQNTQQRLAIEGEDSERPSSAPRHRPREDIGLILGALSRVERR